MRRLPFAAACLAAVAMGAAAGDALRPGGEPAGVVVQIAGERPTPA